jgi:polysaccharide biosynthesis protein PslG
MAHLPRMAALEVWNEPNFRTFFAPHADPRLYARLLRAADDAAHRAHFRQPILTGGLSPGASTGAKMPQAKFLARVYEIAGKGSFDGIGAHPYPSGSPWVADMTANLEQLRTVSGRFGDGSKPLWITEVGIGGTPSGEGHFNVPLDQQGPLLARMYRAVQGMNVRSFLIYTLSDVGGASTSRFATYGVLTPALRPKPAYCYLAQHVGHTGACPLPRLTRAP